MGAAASHPVEQIPQSRRAPERVSSPSLRGRRTLEVIRRRVSPYEDAKDDQNRVNAVEFEEVPMATQDSPSLYDRLGGVYSIATVMDDFIDRIMVDPRLNANPRVDEAHHRVPPAGFKYLVTEMVCWATGGPQKLQRPLEEGLTPRFYDHGGRVGGLSR